MTSNPGQFRLGMINSIPSVPSCGIESDSPGFSCFLNARIFLKENLRKPEFYNPNLCNGNSLVSGNLGAGAATRNS